MFEVEAMVDVAQLDEEAALAAATRLRAIIDRAEADLLAVAAHYADLHPKPSCGSTGSAGPAGPVSGDALPGMERTVVLGGEGCPTVAEFAAVEFGAALGYSSGAAGSLMADALALRHRLPRVWSRVRAGEVQAWRARKIAHATHPLSRPAATLVDIRIARLAQSVTPYRLVQIVAAAVMDADPDQAQANAAQAAGDRGVWVAQSDLYGTKTMVIKAAAGDVIRLDATTDQLAACLAQLGDRDCLDARRAKAIGLLAQPQAALDLWSTATASITAASPFPGTDSTASASTDPAGTDPASTDPASTDPASTDPASTEPASTGPGTTDPASTETRRHGSRTGSGLGGAVTVYVHLTDQTLATGTGLIRATATTTTATTTTTTATTCRTDRTRATNTTPTTLTGAHRATGATGATGAHRATDAASAADASGDEMRRRSEQLRPMLAAQLAELIGRPEAKIVVKPVIDLNQQISVDAYEIPDRIREHVLLRYTTCIFPWCNRPASPGATGIDLDHVVPFDDTGPSGQTSTENLAPGCRLHHRVKTHGGWRCRRLRDGAFEWTSPLGRRYRVDHTGTHPLN